MLRMFENRVLRKTFRPKAEKVTGNWRRLHTEKHHDYESKCFGRMCVSSLIYSNVVFMWVSVVCCLIVICCVSCNLCYVLITRFTILLFVLHLSSCFVCFAFYFRAVMRFFIVFPYVYTCFFYIYV